MMLFDDPDRVREASKLHGLAGLRFPAQFREGIPDEPADRHPGLWNIVAVVLIKGVALGNVRERGADGSGNLGGRRECARPGGAAPTEPARFPFEAVAPVVAVVTGALLLHVTQ